VKAFAGQRNSKAMDWLHRVLMVVLVLSCVGCQQKETQASQQSQPAQAQADVAVKAPGEAKLGDTTNCAVHRQHKIVVTAATPKVEYQGKTYYFCCPVCANKFGERPQDYVK
jgi:YHS domain-containing protein